MAAIITNVFVLQFILQSNRHHLSAYGLPIGIMYRVTVTIHQPVVSFLNDSLVKAENTMLSFKISLFKNIYQSFRNITKFALLYKMNTSK